MKPAHWRSDRSRLTSRQTPGIEIPSSSKATTFWLQNRSKSSTRNLNLQLQLFAGPAAITTLHDATETGVSVAGIFQPLAFLFPLEVFLWPLDRFQILDQCRFLSIGQTGSEQMAAVTFAGL